MIQDMLSGRWSACRQIKQGNGARKHGLTEVTVKHHLKSLRGKLGAKNRTHAVCRAIELGIVPDQPRPDEGQGTVPCCLGCMCWA